MADVLRGILDRLPKPKKGEIDMCYNNTKTFYNEDRARAFAEEMGADIWIGTDAFGQTIWMAKW